MQAKCIFWLKLNLSRGLGRSFWGLLALAIALNVPAVPRAYGQLNTNIVANGSFEDFTPDDASAPNQYAQFASWTSTGNPASAGSGHPYHNYYADFPTRGVTLDPAVHGLSYVVGGGGSDNAGLLQTIDVSFASAFIDSGSAKFDLSGVLGGFSIYSSTLGYQSIEDATTVTATFRNATNSSLGSVTIGPTAIGDISAADKVNPPEVFTGVSFMAAKTAGGILPPGARSIAIQIDFPIQKGPINNGIAEAIDFRVSTVVPEPCSVALVSTALWAACGMLRSRKDPSNL